MTPLYICDHVNVCETSCIHKNPHKNTGDGCGYGFCSSLKEECKCMLSISNLIVLPNFIEDNEFEM